MLPAGRDVTARAHVSVSSHKAGHGAERLTDGDPQSYWQYVAGGCCGPDRRSEGQLPHHVQIDFAERTAIRVQWGGCAAHRPHRLCGLKFATGGMRVMCRRI